MTAPAEHPAAEGGLPAGVHAAAWEDKAALQRMLSRGAAERGDQMHLAGQATGHMATALDLRNFLADLKETPCNPS